MLEGGFVYAVKGACLVVCLINIILYIQPVCILKQSCPIRNYPHP